MFLRRGFGEESGLVFFESSKKPTSRHRTWQYKSRGIVPAAENSGSNGASKLQEMTLRRVSGLVNELQAEHLLSMPWLAAKPLWEYLRRHDLVSLHVWKLFAAAFPNESVFKRFLIPSSKFLEVGGWAKALEPLISQDFSFITVLNIANVTLSRVDIISLPEIMNLGTLAVGPSIVILPDDNFHPYQVQDIQRLGVQDSVDDSILRSWSHSVSQNDRWWAHLRSLHMKNQRQVTTNCFGWISKFASLAEFSIDHLSFDQLQSFESAGADYGWEKVSDNSSSEKTNQDDASREPWYRPGEKDFLDNSILSEKDLGTETVSAINGLPMLHLRTSESTRSAETFRGQRLESRRTPSICLRRHTRAAIAQPVEGQVGSKRSAQSFTASRRVKARNIQDTSSALADFGV